eukprot:4666783-Pleurochrysis_carterae.AAC.1
MHCMSARWSVTCRSPTCAEGPAPRIAALSHRGTPQKRVALAAALHQIAAKLAAEIALGEGEDQHLGRENAETGSAQGSAAPFVTAEQVECLVESGGLLRAIDGGMELLRLWQGCGGGNGAGSNAVSHAGSRGLASDGVGSAAGGGGGCGESNGGEMVLPCARRLLVECAATVSECQAALHELNRLLLPEILRAAHASDSSVRQSAKTSPQPAERSLLSESIP